MKYVNLYTETEYSMLRSPSKVKQLILKAKNNGCEALAMTDYNNMHGAIVFYTQCLEQNIKPIIGINITLASDYNFYNSILLYAMSEIGYKNLLIIASRAKTIENINLDFLSKYSYDVLAVIPSDENEIVKLCKETNYDKAKAVLNKYKLIFKDLYLGVDLQTDANKIAIEDIIKFSKQNNIKNVALNKTSYLNKDDFEAYQALRCIDLGIHNYLYTEKEMSQYFLNEKEFNSLFKEYPELIQNTNDLAAKCNLKLSFGNFKLPVFPDALGNANGFLLELCKLGLNKRLKGENVNVEQYKQRLFYELDIISKMGFSDYFLIVYDFVKYAKKNNILVGPGRGSAPGSLVSYVLGITEIDPLKYNLLFERFLNPERITMPDIDMDFPDNRRDEVIQYVLKKYGKNRVAHISTFGTFGIRLAIRDIARVMKLSDVVLNEILKYVPTSDTSMISIINNNEMFKSLMNENEQIKQLVNLVLKLEGLPRHISTHAAGIIIGDDDLVHYTALQNGINGLYQTQFEASDLEKIGLVKIDFLGLRNLTIIDEVIKKIKKDEPEFELSKIPLDDKYTYQMIASGDTDGIFQLESGGMRNVLIGLKTSEFMDIVNANALYRPGPMEMIPSFIKRKFHQEPIDFIHPDLKEILSSTYGTIVFQEQIILIAKKFAGYTLGMADILRRAVSKKSTQTLVNERERFVSSSIKNGYDEVTSNKVYDYIVKFANYGFNKSHSVAYSMISYQMAYLKRRYYKFFMSELMTNSVGSVGLIKSYIDDCNKKKVTVYLPSVNHSEDYFVVKNGGIYYSLLGVANVGAVTLKNLLNERQAKGVYSSYDDFIARTKEILNKRVVESLILAGALDEFKLTRKTMVDEYENSVNLANYSNLIDNDLIERSFNEEEYSYEEISRLEREYLGFNMKYSIFAKYQNLKRQYKTVNLKDLIVGKRVMVLFAVRKIKMIMTKNNQEMAFLEIFDDTERVDSVLFPTFYQKFKSILVQGAIYVGEGNVDERNNKKQIIFNNIYTVK